jgi:hypothetical protein
MALAGDSTAMRLVMERIAPVRRGRPVKFDMPPVTTSADVAAALGSIIQVVARGDLTPDEAATLSTVLGTKLRALEMVERERRVAELEIQLSRRNY